MTGQQIIDHVLTGFTVSKSCHEWSAGPVFGMLELTQAFQKPSPDHVGWEIIYVMTGMTKQEVIGSRPKT